MFDNFHDMILAKCYSTEPWQRTHSISSHPPPHAGCPRGDPGQLRVLTLDDFVLVARIDELLVMKNAVSAESIATIITVVE